MNIPRPPDKNGRPRSNMKTLKTAQALIEDNLPKLAEKTLQLALMGDTAALALLLDRVWPPRASLPVLMNQDAVRRAMARGHISGDHGAQLLELVASTAVAGGE